MGKACPCVSRRKGAFMAGIFYLILGNAFTVLVTLLFTLHSQEVLWGLPDEDLNKRKQSLGRILIFYVPPALLTLILGVLLTLTAQYGDSRLAEVTFILSTGYVCGVGIEVIGMKLYGAPWLVTSPMLILLVLQMYNFMVTADLRDYFLNHGQRVKTSTERQRLREDPEGDAELNVQLNPAALQEQELPEITRINNNYSVSFSFSGEKETQK